MTEAARQPGEQPPVIRLENVTFSYNNAPVLENVNLCVHERDFAYVVGPNGGGKTTLLLLALGLLQPDAGTVRVFGRSPEDSRQRLGYVPQSHQFDPEFPVRVIDVVLMGRINRSRPGGPYRRADRDAACEALRKVEMDDYRFRRLSALSGGQRQRVMIARALAGEPEALLMDEPTAGLDLQVESELFDLLRALNERLTVMMVSHDVGFVSDFVTKVICVNRNVFVHPTSRVTDEMIREMYGMDVRMVRHDFKKAGDSHE
jgi:zinc transport system ATP-binding protein